MGGGRGGEYLARGARFQVVDPNLLIPAKDRLHEVYLKIKSQVVALLRPLVSPAAAAATAAPAKKSLEYVPEWTEISKVCGSATSSSCTLHASLAKLII